MTAARRSPSRANCWQAPLPYGGAARGESPPAPNPEAPAEWQTAGFFPNHRQKHGRLPFRSFAPTPHPLPAACAAPPLSSSRANCFPALSGERGADAKRRTPTRAGRPSSIRARSLVRRPIRQGAPPSQPPRVRSDTVGRPLAPRSAHGPTSRRPSHGSPAKTGRAAATCPRCP
ncbi:hypothetical protein DI44_14560 [Geobacillus sp. CAMR5420]|nr:hypothetical protein DI44_14560 [Geobacillus sp. CAMR5420]